MHSLLNRIFVLKKKKSGANFHTCSLEKHEKLNNANCFSFLFAVIKNPYQPNNTQMYYFTVLEIKSPACIL